MIQQSSLLKLGVDYLPSIFISGVNFLLPPVFKLLTQLEGYTHSRQIILILLRYQPFQGGLVCGTLVPSPSRLEES